MDNSTRQQFWISEILHEYRPGYLYPPCPRCVLPSYRSQRRFHFDIIIYKPPHHTYTQYLYTYPKRNSKKNSVIGWQQIRYLVGGIYGTGPTRVSIEALTTL